MQVRGLSDVDFRKLDSELRYANRKERINIISKVYGLQTVQGRTTRANTKRCSQNIAKMLGINKEIIDGAQKNIK